MAIACKPQLLIADEPTTIDVTVQKKLSSCWRYSARNRDEYYIHFSWFVLGFRDAHRVLVMYQGEFGARRSKSRYSKSAT
jgi:ABC-type glutathione transport system ATPase component